MLHECEENGKREVGREEWVVKKERELEMEREREEGSSAAWNWHKKQSPRQNPFRTGVAATVVAVAAVAVTAAAAAEAAFSVSSYKATETATDAEWERQIEWERKGAKSECNTISFYARNKNWTENWSEVRRTDRGGQGEGRDSNIFMVKNFKFPLELRSAFLGCATPHSLERR